MNQKDLKDLMDLLSLLQTFDNAILKFVRRAYILYVGTRLCFLDNGANTSDWYTNKAKDMWKQCMS